ncbi:UNKNOWN [Stylonychia lemnae]|uniref:Uncharacterized protein n=1 Tax=Stylonychia lemnae TaxID=5949 RepID=A0A077ZWE9_STYLE|nr:UNKNOWN [Stylonychia lemnae]|eukprot:CDW73916.1 UNKNOWN [Stylonychia lemnae]
MHSQQLDQEIMVGKKMELIMQTILHLVLQNYMVYSNSWFSNVFQQKNNTYQSVREDHYYAGRYQYPQPLAFYFYFDDISITTIRTTYSLADVFVNTGGLLGIIEVTIVLLINSKYGKSKNLKEIIKINKTPNSEVKQRTQKNEDPICKGILNDIKNRINFQNIQNSNFLYKIVLKKYQRQMTPYFKANLIELERIEDKIQKKKDTFKLTQNENHLWGQLSNYKKQQHKLFVKQIVYNAKEVEVDKRILKNLISSKKANKNTDDTVNLIQQNMARNFGQLFYRPAQQTSIADNADVDNQLDISQNDQFKSRFKQRFSKFIINDTKAAKRSNNL